jgi:putative intracellular protease/amidase
MPGASMLDIYGPLEMLYIVAANYYFNLTIITPNGENVVVKPPMGNPHNSTFSPEYVGSASFEDELDLDVLMVPGGAAARDPALTYVDDYLVKMKPQVDYLITICTGAIFAARGGLFDGRRVTTNKNAWSLVTAHGENVTWVAPARYVIDGDIWSSSGVCP